MDFELRWLFETRLLGTRVEMGTSWKAIEIILVRDDGSLNKLVIESFLSLEFPFLLPKIELLILLKISSDNPSPR